MKMRNCKRIVISLVVALSFVITMLPQATVKATDFTSEPIVYGETVQGYVTYPNDNDYYTLSVPSAGMVTVSFKGTANLVVESFPDEFGSTVEYGEIDGTKEYVRTLDISLSKGVYRIAVNGIYGDYARPYLLKVTYDCRTSVKPRVSSPGKGKIKITSSKGDATTGYVIAYRIKGTKKWKTKKVASKKNLNYTITGLKSGKTYEVKVRKYIKDPYGYIYNSNYSSIVKVKVK